jgi:hypothetical protein
MDTKVEFINMRPARHHLGRVSENDYWSQNFVFPAKAGIQSFVSIDLTIGWIPAFAGMTGEHI